MLNSFRIRNYPMSCYPTEPESAVLQGETESGVFRERIFSQARTPPTRSFRVVAVATTTSKEALALSPAPRLAPPVTVYQLPTSLEPMSGVGLNLPNLSARGFYVRATLAALLVSFFCGLCQSFSNLVKLPRLFLATLSTLRASQHQGPLMKTLLAPLFVGSLLISPLVTALGSACYGFARGFRLGRCDGMLAAWNDALNQVSRFDQQFLPVVTQTIQSTLKDSARLALPL